MPDTKIKTKFKDHRDVANLWINQTQHYAGSAERGNYTNLYFEGNTIFSYGDHFPIATITENADGEKAALLTYQHWSSSQSTTNDDVRLVSSVIDNAGIKKIYCFSPSVGMDTNISKWMEDIEELTAQIKKKSNRKFEGRLAALKTAANQLREYINFFHLTLTFEMETKLAFAESDDIVQKLRS